MNNKVILGGISIAVVLAIFVGIVIAVAPRQPSPSAPIVQQTIPPTPVVVAPPAPIEIPITVQELTPGTALVEVMNNASSIERETCCQGDFMEDKISQFDPAVPPRTSPDQIGTESGWTTSLNDGPLFVYFTASPSGTECSFSDSSARCLNPILKVFNEQNNSVATITTDDFTQATEPPINQEHILYLKNDNTILVMGRGDNTGKFILYNPSGRYAFKTKSTPEIKSLLFGDFLVSYNKTTEDLSIEDLVNHGFSQCNLSNSEYPKYIPTSFTNSRVSLSPDGTRLLFLNGKFLWANVTQNWRLGSAGSCLDDFKVVQPNSSSVGGFDLGSWYNNGNNFAITAWQTNAFVYNFEKQYQGPAMAWSDGLDVGWTNNSGYHDKTSLGYKDFSIQTEVAGNELNIYLVNSTGQRSFVKGYPDGGYANWVRIFKDNTAANQFHLLVLNGYTFRQLLDLTIKK